MARGERRRSTTFGAVATALLLLALVAACGEKSRVDPNAQVHVSGSVLGADGAPLATRPVHLGAGISDSEVGLAILTVGVSCSSGRCRGKQLDASTDAGGAYAFTLKGSDSQSTFGEAVSELVTATAAPGAGQVSGAAVSARFKIQVADVHLPTLRLVDPAVQVSRPAAAVHVAWSPVAPGPYDLTFEDGSTAPVWKVTTADGAADVDPRVLEDTSGRVIVSGGSADTVEGSAVDIRWRSPGTGYAGVGAPPSRGASCSTVTASGATALTSSCGLTDGHLDTPATLASPCAAGQSPCPSPIAADVTLGHPVPAELVVVRGCATSCAVSVSSDGATFTEAGTATEGDSTVALGGSPVTAVRVALDPAAPSALREVSVWGPTPAPAAAGDIGDLRDRFGAGGSTSTDRTAAVVVAAVLAAVLLLATGVAIGRRRSPTT